MRLLGLDRLGAWRSTFVAFWEIYPKKRQPSTPKARTFSAWWGRHCRGRERRCAKRRAAATTPTRGQCNAPEERPRCVCADTFRPRLINACSVRSLGDRQATRNACAIAQTFSYEPAAISLSEKAFVTAWRELAAPSLRLTFERWNATVRSEICSAWPISEVVLPPAD